LEIVKKNQIFEYKNCSKNKSVHIFIKNNFFCKKDRKTIDSAKKKEKLEKPEKNLRVQPA
jgi:hypothetical protein